MKKIVLSLCIALLSSGIIFAGNSDQSPAAQDQTNQVALGYSGKDKGQRHGNKDKSSKKNPFEGLNLNEAQMMKIKELRKSVFSKIDSTKENQDKNISKEAKKELKKQWKSQYKDSKKKYLEGLKGILTSEQYVQFLENNYLDSGNKYMGNKTKKHDNKKDQKGKERKTDKKK